MKVFIDPGHGHSNRNDGRYDPGAEGFGQTEAAIVMEYANTLRDLALKAGHEVVRSRVDDKDPAPLSQRVSTAKRYKCDVFVSLHCNAYNGKAHGTEVIYRGDHNHLMAVNLSLYVSQALGTFNRGAKNESASPHGRLAVMAFPKTWLIELAFIDNAADNVKLQDDALRLAACQAILHTLTH